MLIMKDFLDQPGKKKDDKLPWTFPNNADFWHIGIDTLMGWDGQDQNNHKQFPAVVGQPTPPGGDQVLRHRGEREGLPQRRVVPCKVLGGAGRQEFVSLLGRGFPLS